MQLKSLFERISKIKGVGYLAVGLVAALLLMLWPSDSTPQVEPASANEYRLALESEAEEVLSRLEGVGKCHVMITIEYGYEYVYASNQKANTVYNADGSILSVQNEKTYFSSGDGNTLLLRQKMPTVTGIAVVCPGAGGDARLKIVSALSALFGIGSNRISVQS